MRARFAWWLIEQKFDSTIVGDLADLLLPRAAWGIIAQWTGSKQPTL
jgi:hypothetical protein